MMKYWFILFALFLMACTPQAVVYVVATPTPEASGGQVHDIMPTAAATEKQYSFVVPLAITPVVVDMPPSVPIETGDSFTPDVLLWSDKIRSWSVEHGVSERIIAILMQAASCGDPNYDNGEDRFGLFGASHTWFHSGVNMLDPDANAAVALPVIKENMTNFDHVSAFYAYFDGPDQLMTGELWQLGTASERAHHLWMKSRTGAQVCP
jgi:hypothetical protein